MKMIELNIKGIKCEGCVNRIKTVLSSIKGVGSFDILIEDKKLLLSVKNEKIMNAGNGINTGISQKKQKKYNNC